MHEATKDRMDQLIAAAVRQGWTVSQRKTGTWVFIRTQGNVTSNVSARVDKARDLVDLVNALRGYGLEI
jgi:hypothetical protein